MQSGKKRRTLYGDIRNGSSSIPTRIWSKSQYLGEQVQWTEGAVNAEHGQIVFLSTTASL